MKLSSKNLNNLMVMLLTASFIFSACRQINVFEKNTNLPAMKWQNNFNVTGTFNITDTASLYNVYIVIRHTDAYRYNNLWLSAALQPPGDSLVFNRINLTLGNDATGWEGEGMNDIWEVRKPVSSFPKQFKKAGTYNFVLKQIMRDDPLENIISAGMMIEKVISP
jgi:gliding motility-associated lipoprotein GldH